MEVGRLLIAETDPAFLQTLPQFLSNRLPHIDIHVVTSAEEAHWKLSHVSYSASVVAPDLVQDKASLRLHRVRNRTVQMPVILTATKTDVDVARAALLHRGAFDVITKPIHPTDALSSIRIAFWEARLLRLLTQRERALEQIQRHLEAYPKEVEIRAGMESVLDHVEAALTAVRQSMILVEPGSDQLLFDLAVSIEARTKDRALDRLSQFIASAK